MNSTLCFGGSFNPIHKGHIICAKAVATNIDAGQVMLIPSGCPPHKPKSADLAAAGDRLAMCRLVAAEDSLFQVSDMEIRRAGPSYTLETARELRRMGMDSIHWLIGADMLNFLPMWHEPLQLLKEVNFIVVARPGFTFDWTGLPSPFQVLRDHVIEAPLVDVSATEIRRRVQVGESIDELVPAAVADYIRAHRLYA
jgi:nicotinate-nucleotide adenylyltransferase